MKNILIVLSLLISVVVSGQNDQKAKDLLEQVSKKTQSYQTLSANFTFTMENSKMNIKEQNSGSMFMKGKKYQVKLPDLGMQVFCDGKTVWNFMETANQVTISDAGDESQGAIDPTAIFNVYQVGYNYKFVEDKTINGKLISFVELFPQDKSKEFTKITVGVEKAKLMIYSLVTHGKDGNQYGIYVKDFKIDQPVADADFVFVKAKYKGVEEVDFR